MNEKVLSPAGQERISAQPRQSQERTDQDWAYSWSAHSDDLAYGQLVIVAARWILVATVLVLAVWNANSLGELKIQLLAILGLAGMNFYIHGHLLMKRPFPVWAVFGATAVDLLTITVITAVQGGYESSVYLFYFPAILGFSVAFPSAITGLMVVATCFFYGVISVTTGGPVTDTFLITTSRLIMLAGTAACGILYQRLERRRRQAVAEAQEKLMAQISRRSTPTASVNTPPIVKEGA